MTAAPFLARVVAGSTPTTTGTQTYESPGFGTPVGAIVYGAAGAVLGTPRVGAAYTWCALDGTNEHLTFGYDRHNLGTTEAKHGGDNDGTVFRLYSNTGTIIIEGVFDSWSANGITINWTTVVGISIPFAIMLVGGTNAQAFAFRARATAAGTVVSPGFATDLILTNVSATDDGTLAGQLEFQPGIAAPSSTNTGCGMKSDDAVSTTESTRIAASDNLGVVSRIQPGLDLVGAETTIDTYTGTGFTVRGDVGGTPADGHNIAGLAIDTGGASVFVDTAELSPGSTGVQNYTGPGVKSGFLVSVYSLAPAHDYYNTFGAAGMGMSDFQTERSMALQSENGAATSNTTSLVSDKIIDLWTHNTSSQVIEADSAQQASGFDLDWTTVDAGTPRAYKFVAIEEMPQVIEPGGIASGEAFGTPTLAPGAVTIEPGGIASGEAFGTPTLQATALVAPGAIGSEEAFGTPTVVAGVVVIEPGGIASGEAFGTPTLDAGAVVQPGGIASGEAFGTPTLAPGALTIEPGGIASGEAFGTPTVAAGLTVVLPGTIASEEALGTPTLVAGTVTISVPGIASGEALGQPTLLAAQTVEPGGIPSAEAFGTPTLVEGLVVVAPGGIASEEALGTPTVAPGAVTVTPGGIASEESLGTPTLVQIVVVRPTGIASAEALGLPTLTPGEAFVVPGGIPSAEALGLPSLLGGDTIILLSGIASEEVLGTPFLSGGFIPVTLKKKIHDALIAAAKGGTFVTAEYDGDTCTLEQGTQVMPESILANEIESAYSRDGRHGRKLRDDRTAWRWELRLRFHQEVITELFEETLLADPIVIPREPGDPSSRQAIVSLLNARFEHPPQQGASNGTEVVFEVNAQVCPA